MHPITGVIALVVFALPAHAGEEMSATELAKLAQNPVGNLISVPFQNITNLNFGPVEPRMFTPTDGL